MCTNTIHIALNCKRTLYTGVAYTSYFAGSLNIFIGKTPVFSSGVPFAHLSIGKKLYYNSGLFSNRNIDPTNISL